MRHLAWLLIGVTLAGCSARRATPVVSPAAAIDLAPADALFDAGCYRCLAEAFSLYDRARVQPGAPLRARTRAFATAVLLTLREKELDLDATPWLERARELAEMDDSAYLDIAAALPWDGGSTPDFALSSRLSPNVLDDWQNFTMPQGRHPELDAYILITLQCRLATRVQADETIRDVADMSPLLQFRAGLCGPQRRPLLEALVAADPRFVEAWYFIGRYEMTTGVNQAGGSSRTWLVTAVRPLQLAHTGLPEAPTVTTVLAGLMRARSDLRAALALYDDALAHRPTHGDALLGRTITLSFLKRYDDAITQATGVITLGRGHVPSAYYYRAWNQYQLGELNEALRDVMVAKQMNAPEEVLVLSGLIAYEQKRPVDARADFTAAVAGNNRRCTAHWYLGILNLDEEQWTPAVGTFTSAGDCYSTAAAALRREITQLPEDLPDTVRAEQVASLDEDILVNARQAGRSFFNAAQAAARAGESPTALNLARRASSYEEMRERAETLVKRLTASPVTP